MPGQLLGHGNVDLAIQYGNNSPEINWPACSAYPGKSQYTGLCSSAATSAVESGISYGATN